MAFTKARLTHRQHDARRKPLDIPFPRRRKSLVEIVDVEDKLPFRSAKAAKIGHVTIAASLHANSRDRCWMPDRPPSETAEPRKNAKGDARIRAYRIGRRLGQPSAVRFCQQFDGIWPVLRGRPFRMRGSRNFLAKFLSRRQAIFRAAMEIGRVSACEFHDNSPRLFVAWGQIVNPTINWSALRQRIMVPVNCVVRAATKIGFGRIASGLGG